ncbi:MAG: HAMP domain-containing sensor histidine kinase [Leptolyngbyaceae cyanobacterium MO_188.B28]|nr:HAMP domain-containing sensor histidine kinase [Leptolyngbyaceae cyanobacterium MO_188.B28]
MSWTNLIGLSIGLLAGLGLGVGGSWLRKRKPSPPPKSGPPCQDTDSKVLALQNQLRQTQLAYWRMAEMEQFKSGFLGRTSHELRSPISQLLSLHQMILSDLCDDPAEEREFIAQATLSAQTMLARLDHLIDVSKLEVGRVQPKIQPLNLAEVFNQVYQFTHMQAANQALFLTVSSPDPDLYILADPKWLQQALVSLVQSSIALTKTGSIQLFVPPQSPNSDQVYIWLEDHRPAAAWSEPLDLLPETAASIPQASPVSSVASPAKGPSLPLTPRLEEIHSLLRAMHGRIDILSTPVSPTSGETGSDLPDPDLTRIQCSIPNASDSALDE